MMRPTAWAVFAVGAIVGTALCRAEDPSELATRLEVVSKRHEGARERYHAELAGQTTEERQKPAIDRYRGEVRASTLEILEAVRAAPRDPAVVSALQFVIDTARTGPGDESRQALEILMDHAADPGMGVLCGRIFYFAVEPAAEELIRAVLRRAPRREDRGRACAVLADYLRHQARMVRRVREEPSRLGRYVDDARREVALKLIERTDPESRDREVEGLLERVIAEFADLKWDGDARTLGSIAEGELFAMRNLAVGKVAPEIVGEDHEGRTFRLSDFRGKVVLLTFSGNWCGPCVAYYPQERALIERLKSGAFAAVSVNTDQKVETLREAVARRDVTWRCWWDGPDGTSGPITTRWGVSSFPSAFVLDEAGVIRFKDVRGEEIDRAVDSLLAEAEKR
ncbi:peroxiredoxin family protein [Paludisphaera mucosa]|uniref:TlpA disulfide reductase family protein n=1 Tax=Paludisphaera mucosa TaxID=3030827 RepID=A0ABT6FBF1_9BACT|nr:TlpA disulfide reductase family protein [Paludisphaera mucosa]MDG3004862.1 TlpA disulfide reductase family protein [Paludisphaera mucosa]